MLNLLILIIVRRKKEGKSVKMVFIWNGIDYKMVDDEEFGKNATGFRGYVVSRRLLVSLSKSGRSESTAKVNKILFEFLLSLNSLIIFHLMLSRIICANALRSMVQSNQSKYWKIKKRVM